VLSRLQAHYEERKVRGMRGYGGKRYLPLLGGLVAPPNHSSAVFVGWPSYVSGNRSSWKNVLFCERERGTGVSASDICERRRRYLSRDSHGDRKDIRGGQFQELVDLTVHHITALLGQEGQA